MDGRAGISSESGFTGLQDSQDYPGARVFASQALAHIPLGEIPVMGKSASRAKRNPENPANPVNPDSDKAAPSLRHSHLSTLSFPPSPAVPAFYPAIPAKAGIHKPANSLAIRNQAPRPDCGSLLPVLTSSFPRKRESRGLQPSQSPEIKYKYQPADPFSLHGRRLG